MTAGQDEMQIPSGWLQRLSKREFLGLIMICVAMGTWAYSVNADMIIMKERLTRVETKLDAMNDKFKERDKETAVVLAVLSNNLSSIDLRLKSIEANVRRMAQ